MRTISVVSFDPTEKHKSYLCLIFFVLNQLNLIYIFFCSRVKYDDSKNKNNFVMRTILIVGFYSIKKQNSYLVLTSFSF